MDKRIKANTGSIMMWVIIVLFVVSLILVTYARITNLNYNISASMFRQQSAVQYAYAGLAIAQDYFSDNSAEISAFNSNYDTGESQIVYPDGSLDGSVALLTDYSIEQIYLHKDSAGRVLLYTEATYLTATSTIFVEITDINVPTFGNVVIDN